MADRLDLETKLRQQSERAGKFRKALLEKRAIKKEVDQLGVGDNSPSTRLKGFTPPDEST
jgi:hypothetical protein